jgi:hypothetical protein
MRIERGAPDMCPRADLLHADGVEAFLVHERDERGGDLGARAHRA